MDGPLQSLKHDNKIYSLKWSPAPAKGVPVLARSVWKRPISVIGSVADTSFLLHSASFDHTTKIWSALEGTCLFTLEGHTNPVYSVDFSPDGTHIASGSFDKSVMVWSLEVGTTPLPYPCAQTTVAHRAYIGPNFRMTDGWCKHSLPAGGSLRCAGTKTGNESRRAAKTVQCLSQILAHKPCKSCH